MKFDNDRAMDCVQAFSFAREAGSEGERHAADLLAERLEGAGWRVSRVMSRTGCRLSTLIMILLLTLLVEEYTLWKALQFSAPALPRLARALLLVTSFVLLGGLLRLAIGRDGIKIARQRFVEWRLGKTGAPTSNLIAEQPSQLDRSTRVFILTHLDTPLPTLVREDGVCGLIILALLVLLVLGLSRTITAWSVVTIFWVALLFQARFWLRKGRPSAGDNRTGLAVLAELPQALPSRLSDRAEIRLAAVSGSSAGYPGSLTLADEIRRQAHAKPTLVINLDSPGLGSELRLVGTGPALELARGAAKDLWIPHRVLRRRFCLLDHRPFQINGIPAITLSGDRNGSRIEPATLAATAQLATEIAMRWARQRA